MNLKLLTKLCYIPNYSTKEQHIIDFIIKYINKNIKNVNITVDKKNNIYVTKGTSETYPCIVCHTDSVFKQTVTTTVLKYNNILYGFDTAIPKSAGLGFDDKCGIYIALKALETFSAIKVAFFVEEEIGCKGSIVADMTFFDDCRFVLQADRKGNSDFITKCSEVSLSTSEFIKDIDIKKYGYHEAAGLSTDVKALKINGLKVCCANISCGYYNPHSENECCVIKDLEKCWNLIEHIIKDCTKVYKHVYVSTPVTITYANDYNSPIYYPSSSKQSYSEQKEAYKLDVEAYLLYTDNPSFWNLWKIAYQDYPSIGYFEMKSIYESIKNNGTSR